MLPNYIIAGAQKAGTTTVFKVIKQHHDVFVPKIKEIHFFDRTENFRRGKKYYLKYFLGGKNQKIVMDITPNYMYVKEVPKRIKEILPEVKLIFFLRDPIKRAYSNYWHNVRYQAEKLSFSEAIKVKGNPYIMKSMYFKHLERFLKYFDKQDILIFISERMFNDPLSFYKKFFYSIGINYLDTINYNIKENSARVPKFVFLEKIFFSEKIVIRNVRKMVPRKIKDIIRKLDEKINMKQIDLPSLGKEIKEFLVEKFKQDVYNLKKEFSLDLTDWRDFN